MRLKFDSDLSLTAYLINSANNTIYYLFHFRLDFSRFYEEMSRKELENEDDI